MYFLTEIVPSDLGVQAMDHPQELRRWKVVSPCKSNKRTSAEVLVWIQAMEKVDQHRALNGLLFLIKLAQSGQPLSAMVDKKKLHEAHDFYCDVSRKREKIWRYRAGDVRVLFYYGRDRLILLTSVMPKRTNKYSAADLQQATAAVRAYLVADVNESIKWLHD
jgi:mRNA-degrading endonuclease RelE of RelBE toxin-antitoxin system